jgi:hypothetical protein
MTLSALFILAAALTRHPIVAAVLMALGGPPRIFRGPV